MGWEGMWCVFKGGLDGWGAAARDCVDGLGAVLPAAAVSSAWVSQVGSVSRAVRAYASRGDGGRENGRAVVSGVSDRYS